MVGVLIRAVTYATIFIALVLVYLPAQALAWAGAARPERFGLPQLLGAIVTLSGAALAVWCILTFALVGRGTPAPFDPPRQLVVRGPYRYVRNPMYLGAGLALAGAALVYQSGALLAYAGVFLLLMHAFVVWSEEPKLRQTFGQDYEAYCRQVRRWWPVSRSKGSHAPLDASTAGQNRLGFEIARSRPTCCKRPSWSSEVDLGHAAGFEYILGKCDRCGRYWMNVFCVASGITGFEPVSLSDVEQMKSVQTWHELKALMRKWDEEHL
jgi:protein-S-isoprenylcysteine O-methyltransferase Ste14